MLLNKFVVTGRKSLFSMNVLVFRSELLGVLGLALRVSLAVTWLTVYRQLHIEQATVCLHSESNTGAELIGRPSPTYMTRRASYCMLALGE